MQRVAFIALTFGSAATLFHAEGRRTHVMDTEREAACILHAWSKPLWAHSANHVKLEKDRDARTHTTTHDYSPQHTHRISSAYQALRS